ncbi:hypothetical protein C2E23DRAFT_799966 [Lenzites betulinus]|nr:hypothetical protein C2E23DRAFT_799966 [Lenzites betulinus]
MIRRPPTQIPMTDMDVQQVRDAIAAQKSAAAQQVDTSASTATPAQPKGTPAPSQPYHHAEEAKKKRAAMSRDERLGLR